MSIEAISSVIQPPVVKVDGLHNLRNQDPSVMFRATAAQTELPSQALKGITEAEEEEMLKDAAKRANEFVGTLKQELHFSVDKDTGRTVVKVLDKQTGETIRQIPSDEMLSLAKALDTLQGLIIRDKV